MPIKEITLLVPITEVSVSSFAAEKKRDAVVVTLDGLPSTSQPKGNSQIYFFLKDRLRGRFR